MQRRDFITLPGGTVATWPLAARAQQPAGRVYRVGYLGIPSREQTLHLTKAFEEGLGSLGYRVGENVAIEYRFANGELERLPALATELVRLGVDVIVIPTNQSIVAAMKATTTIPIVMVAGGDPVSAGFVASLARPGGNVTGLAVDAGSEILGKRFELLKEMLPNLSRVGILFNPDVVFNRSRQTPMTETARTLGLTTITVEARGLDALEQAFATMVKERAQAFVMQGDSVLFNHRGQIAEMALRNRLPAASLQKEYADAGFLLTYGADVGDLFRRSAVFVDKIFKGAKPTDLPVEQPVKFELVINMKTAKALGITIPPSLLARADEVIELGVNRHRDSDRRRTGVSLEAAGRPHSAPPAQGYMDTGQAIASAQRAADVKLGPIGAQRAPAGLSFVQQKSKKALIFRAFPPLSTGRKYD